MFRINEKLLIIYKKKKKIGWLKIKIRMVDNLYHTIYVVNMNYYTGIQVV